MVAIRDPAWSGASEIYTPTSCSSWVLPEAISEADIGMAYGGVRCVTANLQIRSEGIIAFH